MSVELKIKAKHLALEPSIIRKEEKKLLKQIKWWKAQLPNDEDKIYSLHSKRVSLSNHRKWDVRNEARATQLARAFLKQVPYRTVEQKSRHDYNFRVYILPRVFAMVAKYGPKKIHKFWTGKAYDFRKEEADPIMNAIKEWLGIE